MRALFTLVTGHTNIVWCSQIAILPSYSLLVTSLLLKLTVILLKAVIHLSTPPSGDHFLLMMKMVQVVWWLTLMLVEYGNHRLKDHTIQKKTKYSAVEDRRGHFSPLEKPYSEVAGWVHS